MTPMKFVVKYFSEIAIKSKPVRRRFVTQLVRKSPYCPFFPVALTRR
jgi:hypothetical protein